MRMYGHNTENRQFVNTIQNMTMNYLLTFALGKIEFKLAWNAYHWIPTDMKYVLKGLNQLFNVNVKEAGSLTHLHDDESYCYNEMDYLQYAISATKKK